MKQNYELLYVKCIDCDTILKALGYPLNDENLFTVEGFMTTAKSFVSCAVGKMGS